MRGHSLEHHRGRDSKIDGRGHLYEMPSGQGEIFSVGAVPIRNAIGDAVTDFDILDFSSNRGDRAGRLGAGNVGQGPLVMSAPMKTGAVVNIEIVNAGGFNFDQRLVCIRLWRGNFLVAKHFRPAELM